MVTFKKKKEKKKKIKLQQQLYRKKEKKKQLGGKFQSRTTNEFITPLRGGGAAEGVDQQAS